MPSYLTSATTYVNALLLNEEQDSAAICNALECSCIALRRFAQDFSSNTILRNSVIEAGKQHERVVEILDLSGSIETFARMERDVLLSFGLPSEHVRAIVSAEHLALLRQIQPFSINDFEATINSLQRVICEISRDARRYEDQRKNAIRLRGAALGLSSVTVFSANALTSLAAVTILPMSALHAPVAAFSVAWGYEKMKRAKSLIVDGR